MLKINKCPFYWKATPARVWAVCVKQRERERDPSCPCLLQRTGCFSEFIPRGSAVASAGGNRVSFFGRGGGVALQGSVRPLRGNALTGQNRRRIQPRSILSTRQVSSASYQRRTGSFSALFWLQFWSGIREWTFTSASNSLISAQFCPPPLLPFRLFCGGGRGEWG